MSGYLQAARTFAKAASKAGRKVVTAAGEVATGMPRSQWASSKKYVAFGATGTAALGVSAIRSAVEAEDERRRIQQVAMREADVIEAERTRVVIEQATEERLRKDMITSVARLAQSNPHLYQEIMAGRRLPKGAVVLGGRPRVDLMQQLAYSMAKGDYLKPQPEDELAVLARQHGGM